VATPKRRRAATARGRTRIDLKTLDLAAATACALRISSASARRPLYNKLGRYQGKTQSAKPS